MIAGCTKSSRPEFSNPPTSTLEDVIALPDTVVTHNGDGVVRSINPSKTSIVIRHQAIDSFMSAMTMPFPIDDTTVVDGVAQGDSIGFEISVRGSLVSVTNIEVRE